MRRAKVINEDRKQLVYILLEIIINDVEEVLSSKHILESLIGLLYSFESRLKMSLNLIESFLCQILFHFCYYYYISHFF